MPNSLNLDELCLLLAAGINVVTTCGAFHHPPSMDPDIRAKVRDGLQDSAAHRCTAPAAAPVSSPRPSPWCSPRFNVELTALDDRRVCRSLPTEFAGAPLRPDGLRPPCRARSSSSEPTTCARVSARRCGWSPMRSGCPSTRLKQAGSWRWPAATRRSQQARLQAGNVAAQRITVSGIAQADRLLSGSGPRGTAPPTSILDGRSGRPAGMCRSTATHRWRSLSGCRSRWSAWPRCRPPTPPTARSTRCPMSAPPPRASSRRWTFPRSSRRWDEKLILLSGEYKLPEMSLLLTPARGRCQSCETNCSHLSYATLVQREATRDDQC